MQQPSLHSPYLVIATPQENKANDLWQLLTKRRKELQKLLLQHGSLLIRGFQLSGEPDFPQVLHHLFPERSLQSYDGGLGHKENHHQGIYSSTEVPSRFAISPHHEMAYLPNMPQNIAFMCLQPAQIGGRTPLVCGHQLYQSLDTQTIERFTRLGIRYTRTYLSNDSIIRRLSKHPLVATWQSVFGAESQQMVEQKCIELGLQYSWLTNNVLQTTVNLPAIRQHPISQVPIWCNQAHTFVVTKKYLGSALYILYKTLYRFRSMRQAEACFGNGESIPESTIDTIHTRLKEHQHLFTWQKNDVLILDNLRMMHGRETFSGQRKIITAML